VSAACHSPFLMESLLAHQVIKGLLGYTVPLPRITVTNIKLTGKDDALSTSLMVT
jgi:hypothetical protein